MRLQQLLALCLLAGIVSAAVAYESEKEKYTEKVHGDYKNKKDTDDYYKSSEEYKEYKGSNDYYKGSDDYYKGYDENKEYKDYYKAYDKEHPEYKGHEDYDYKGHHHVHHNHRDYHDWVNATKPTCNATQFHELMGATCIDPNTGRPEKCEEKECEITKKSWCKKVKHTKWACRYDYKPRGRMCRIKGGDCDVADYCPGHSPHCPHYVQPKGHVCKPGKGPCERDAKCNGKSTECPSNKKVPDGTPCKKDDKEHTYEEAEDHEGKVYVMSEDAEVMAKKHGWAKCTRCHEKECKVWKYEWWGKADKHGKYKKWMKTIHENKNKTEHHDHLDYKEEKEERKYKEEHKKKSHEKDYKEEEYEKEYKDTDYSKKSTEYKEDEYSEDYETKYAMLAAKKGKYDYEKKEDHDDDDEDDDDDDDDEMYETKHEHHDKYGEEPEIYCTKGWDDGKKKKNKKNKNKKNKDDDDEDDDDKKEM